MVFLALTVPTLLAIALASGWISIELARPVNTDTFYATVFLLACTLVGFALYYRRRAAALQQLVDVSERISDGDLEARARINSTGEVGELAEAVNHMADELVGALRDVERERSAVLSAVIEAVVEIDTNGEILAANPATEKLFGWSENELVGNNISMILPSANISERVASGQGACANRDGMEFPEGCEFDGRHQDGRQFPVNMSVARRSYHGKPRFVGVITDLSEQQAYIQKLEEIAFYDPVTRIPARRLVLDRLDTALRRAQRNQSQFAVLFIDLDRFKPINDEYGHAVGDTVLAEVAQRLLKATRESDTVGRVGGDEFVVVAENISSRDDIWTIVDRYAAVINQPISTAASELEVHASIGAACFPDDARTASELLDIADGRMYENKPYAQGDAVVEQR